MLVSLPDMIIEHDSQAGQLATAGIDGPGIRNALERLIGHDAVTKVDAIANSNSSAKANTPT